MASAFRIDPCARAMADTRPSTIRLKYSAAPNFRAIAVRGGANSATSSVATVPAKNDPSAATAKAVPALPFRAIW